MLILSKTSSKAEAAFSLVELLTVVAIMATMLVLGLSLGPGLLKSGAMSGGLSQVASSLSLARSEAIRSRKPTFFVLAPTDSLDERSYRSYSILQRNPTNSSNFIYLSRWEKLPNSVLFRPDRVPATNQLKTTNFPYPTDGPATTPMLFICFQGEGGLHEDFHPIGEIPKLALQSGVRVSPTDPPDFQGEYLTNEVGVRRITGKIFVERQ